MKYKIINSGSDGNAVVIEDEILIDCGVSFKKLADDYKSLRLVLLTHIHTDHFNKRTISRLGQERPTLRFGCCDWLAEDLASCGITRADIYKTGRTYDYGAFQLEPVKLTHNVENCGYKITIGGQKLFYATDTGNLDGVEAKGYDLYMVEANYTDEEMAERIRQKEASGVYPYEYEVMQNHLSKTKCDNFIYQNITGGEYIYMHQHKGGESHVIAGADSGI
jgi:conserved hypothetical protein